MCLAIPSQIVEIENDMGVIDVAGVRRKASLLMIEEPAVGDWVIVHAGFAIKRIDESVALESLRYLREAASLLEDPPEPPPSNE